MYSHAYQFMMSLVDARLDMYLDEIVMKLSSTLGVDVSISTIHRELKLLGYTMKKVQLYRNYC